MPLLLQDIEVEITEPIENSNNLKIGLISGLIGKEDYFKVNTLEGFIQNLTKCVDCEEIATKTNFGLKNNAHTEVIYDF